MPDSAWLRLTHHLRLASLSSFTPRHKIKSSSRPHSIDMARHRRPVVQFNMLVVFSFSVVLSLFSVVSLFLVVVVATLLSLSSFIISIMHVFIWICLLTSSSSRVLTHRTNCSNSSSSSSAALPSTSPW